MAPRYRRCSTPGALIGLVLLCLPGMSPLAVAASGDADKARLQGAARMVEPAFAEPAAGQQHADRLVARDGRSRARRRSQVWEVHLILADGRRQVLRGVREPSREPRVMRLRVDASTSDASAHKMLDGGATAPGRPNDAVVRSTGSVLRGPVSSCAPSVERIEGGFVAPKAVRCADRRTP